MLSRSARSVVLRSKIGSRTLVTFPLPRAIASNNMRAVTHFQLQTAHAFSTEKVTKEEEPVPQAAETSKSTAVAKYDYDEHDDYDYEEPKTRGQKFRFYGILALRLSFLALGAGCVYFTAKELFPGRMNPNSLFSEAFEKLRYNEEVLAMAGNSMKAFGRDVGRSTEGRRNHIDSYEYTAEDGSKRTRIRFNIKGDKAKVLVWAEISERMAHGEFVYIVCQSAKTGRIFTYVDNREQLENDMRTNTDPSDNFFKSIFSKKEGSA